MNAKQFLLLSVVICLLAACSGNAQTPATATAVTQIVPTAVPTATGQPKESSLALVWSSTGDPNPFSSPDGMGLDQEGNLYVSDAGNGQIQKLDSQGHLITKWGSKGKGDGQFSCVPCGLAVDHLGNVYVTDFVLSRVQKFDSSGGFLAQWGGSGHEDGQLGRPFGVAVDQQGNVYIGDPASGRIQKFDSDGNFLMKFGSLGDEDGQFSSDLADLAVDAQGDIYVTDRSIGLQKFDSTGKFLAKWDSCGDDKRLTGATGVTSDLQGNIYVYDTSNSRICKFDPNGNPLAVWGGLDNAVGFIAVDQQGDIYVAEPFNDFVKKFRQP